VAFVGSAAACRRAAAPDRGAVDGAMAAPDASAGLPESYRARLVADAERFAIAGFSPDAITAPLRHDVAFVGRRRLWPGRHTGLDLEHLRLSLAVKREAARAFGGTYSADHALLTIVNRTAKHLAYRVVTEVPEPRRCVNQAELEHDAVALKPHQEITRSECTLDPRTEIHLTRVEVIELTPLAYHYLSRVPPAMLLLDARTAAGHFVGSREPCPDLQREERAGWAQTSGPEWRDLVDFYARHSCAAYRVFPGYRFRERADGALPAMP
jgi:hypothetical protein